MTRIPADLDTPDRVLWRLTMRQVAILAGTALTLYGAWQATQGLLPGWVAAVAAVPVGAAGLCLALLRRDGVSLDRVAGHGLAFHTAPRRLRSPAAAGEARVPEWLLTHTDTGHDSGPGRDTGGADWDTRLGTGGRSGVLRLAAQGVHEHGWGGLRVGIIDLGEQGAAVIAACSTVNLALRSDAEQQGLTGCFARLLASTAGPVQIVIRTQPLDLSSALRSLDTAITTLAPQALRIAAQGHRDYLAAVAATKPLIRHVLLVLREPVPTTGRRPVGGPGGWVGAGGPARAAAVARLLARLAEAQRCLAPGEITVRPCDAATTTAVLASAADPDRPLTALSTTATSGPPRTATATATSAGGWL